jgi:hypothetical protein
MVPNRENAQKFLASGHWAGRVAFQLYSYPVAFANTIARNAARDVVMTRGHSLPKVMAGGYLMYLTTGFTQALKTRGKSEEREGWEKFKYVLDTIGLFGPYSLAYNMMENIDYGNNVPKAAVRLMGPTVGKLVIDLFNDTSTPFSMVLIKNTMPYRNLIKAASPKTIHEIDEFLKDLERRRLITRHLGVTPEGKTTRLLKRLEADQKFLEEQVAGKEIRELEKLEKEQKDALLRLAEGGKVGFAGGGSGSPLTFNQQYHLDTIRLGQVLEDKHGNPVTAKTVGVEYKDKIYNLPSYDRRGGFFTPEELKKKYEIEMETGVIQGYPIEFDGPIENHPANVAARAEHKMMDDNRKEALKAVKYRGGLKEGIREAVRAIIPGLAEGGKVSKDYPVPFAKDNPSERKIDLEEESYAKVAGLFEEPITKLRKKKSLLKRDFTS